MCCRDKTKLRIAGARRTHPSNHPLFQHPQQARLKLQGHVANLIKKDGAHVTRLKNTGTSALHRPGKCALFITKQFAFQQGLGQGCAIECYERTPRPAALCNDGLGDQFFTGTRLTLNEHTAIGGCIPLNELSHLLHGLRLAQQGLCRLSGTRRRLDGRTCAQYIALQAAQFDGLIERTPNRPLRVTQQMFNTVLGGQPIHQTRADNDFAFVGNQFAHGTPGLIRGSIGACLQGKVVSAGQRLHFPIGLCIGHQAHTAGHAARIGQAAHEVKTVYGDEHQWCIQLILEIGAIGARSNEHVGGARLMSALGIDQRILVGLGNNFDIGLGQQIKRDLPQDGLECADTESDDDGFHGIDSFKNVSIPLILK